MDIGALGVGGMEWRADATAARRPGGEATPWASADDGGTRPKAPDAPQNGKGTARVVPLS